LHRLHYTEATLQKMSRLILKEEQYWDSDKDAIFEDMLYMSDLELHRLCLQCPSIAKHQLSPDLLMDSAKIRQLVDHILPEQMSGGNRLLIFSQFTMVNSVLHFKLDP
jgi:SWI/SNF-related matrix-associated actin-dependent regulator 1 of chromatin subfamily A